MNSLRRRPARTIPSTIVCLVLVALAVGLAWAAITRLSGGQWPSALSDLAERLAGVRADSNESWAAAIITVIVGLALLLCAWIPGRANASELEPPPAPSEAVVGTTSAVITNRGLANLVAGSAEQVDGVTSVRTSATSSRVDVRVTTPLRSTEGLVTSVNQRINNRLDGVALASRPRVRVSATTREMI